jgi:hypothetical protein
MHALSEATPRDRLLPRRARTDSYVSAQSWTVDGPFPSSLFTTYLCTTCVAHQDTTLLKLQISQLAHVIKHIIGFRMTNMDFLFRVVYN